jgi:hypothetical protein
MQDALNVVQQGLVEPCESLILGSPLQELQVWAQLMKTACGHLGSQEIQGEISFSLSLFMFPFSRAVSERVRWCSLFIFFYRCHGFNFEREAALLGLHLIPPEIAICVSNANILIQNPHLVLGTLENIINYFISVS